MLKLSFSRSKFLVIGLSIIIIGLFSCDKNDSNSSVSEEFKVAQKQLMADYSKYNIGEITWNTKDGYQIGKFCATTKANSTSISAWYKVSGETAARQMDVQKMGQTIPEIIRLAFEATIYSNTQLWKIDEIELENTYNGNAMNQVYEMELDQVTPTSPKLEAELYFDAKTGELLFSKETIDDDNDNDYIDDDKFVVNTELKTAVENIYSDAEIIDAELDDNKIEVDAIATIEAKKREVEMLFSKTYDYIQSEYEITYAELPSKFAAIQTWFATNTFPTPAITTEVEITEGINLLEDGTPFKTHIEIEYKINNIEYEVEFYLDANNTITKYNSEIDD